MSETATARPLARREGQREADRVGAGFGAPSCRTALPDRRVETKEVRRL